MKPHLMCRHFTGIQHTSCEEGISYESVRPLPCFGEHACAKYSPYTKEELAAQDAERVKHVEKMFVARAAVIAESKKLGFQLKVKSVSGRIDCPCCEGVQSLRFSRSSYNGHVHASCTTADCVRWME